MRSGSLGGASAICWTMADELDGLVCRHLEIADGGRAIGFSPHLRVECFIDLLSAMLIPRYGQILVEALREILPATGDAKWGIVRQKRTLPQQVAQRFGPIRRRCRKMPVEGASRPRRADHAQRVSKVCGTPEVDSALQHVAQCIDS